MRPAEIKRLIKKLCVSPSARLYHRTLSDALEAQAESRKLKSAQIPKMWVMVTESRITKLTAAAALIVAVGFLVIHTRPRPQAGTDALSPAAKSPGEMMTAMSLKIAYRRGGLDAVEKQCDKAFKMLGLQPTRISIRELLDEFNGEEPERKKS